MRVMLVIFLLAVTSFAKNCDFIGKRQGDIITSSDKLQTLCGEFGAAYKEAKGIDQKKADIAANEFTKNAKKCGGEKCLEKSFDNAISDLKISKPVVESKSTDDSIGIITEIFNWLFGVISLAVWMLSVGMASYMTHELTKRFRQVFHGGVTFVLVSGLTTALGYSLFEIPTGLLPFLESLWVNLKLSLGLFLSGASASLGVVTLYWVVSMFRQDPKKFNDEAIKLIFSTKERVFESNDINQIVSVLKEGCKLNHGLCYSNLAMFMELYSVQILEKTDLFPDEEALENEVGRLKDICYDKGFQLPASAFCAAKKIIIEKSEEAYRFLRDMAVDGDLKSTELMKGVFASGAIAKIHGNNDYVKNLFRFWADQFSISLSAVESSRPNLKVDELCIVTEPIVAKLDQNRLSEVKRLEKELADFLARPAMKEDEHLWAAQGALNGFETNCVVCGKYGTGACPNCEGTVSICSNSCLEAHNRKVHYPKCCECGSGADKVCTDCGRAICGDKCNSRHGCHVNRVQEHKRNQVLVQQQARAQMEEQGDKCDWCGRRSKRQLREVAVFFPKYFCSEKCRTEHSYTKK